MTITPAANQFGTATITVTVTDADGGTGSDTFVLTVSSVNDNPTISDVTNKSTPEDTATGPHSITVGDMETAAATLTLSGSSSNTTLVPNANITFGGSGANRTVTVTPATNQFGTATITVTLTDADGGTTSDTFVLTVSSVNDAPTANNDAATTNENSSVSINVLANDTDPDTGDTFSVSSVTQGAHGTVAVIPAGPDAGKVSYVPNLNFNGTDTFTYKAKDSSNAESNVATVTVTVSNVNNSPVANNDLATTNEDVAVSINVLFNDTDADTGDLLSVSSVTQAANGTVAIITTGPDTGKVRYTPNLNFNGTDTFTYKAKDSANPQAESNSAIVVVTITAVNDAPTAVNDAGSTNEDAAVNMNVLANDTDPDALDTLLVSSLTQGANGTVTVNVDNTLKYTPNANFNGTDTFTYKAKDASNVESNSATVTITVNALNDNPTISDIVNQSTNEDVATSAIAFTIGDAETAAASLTVSGSSSNTTVVPNANIVFGGGGANRTVTVTPASNQSGTTTITVTVTDANGGSSSDTFVLTVNPINDNPTISDIANQSTNEDTATSAIAFTVGDAETAAGSLTVSGGSSNTTLVPNTNIVFGGSGANRTVTATPVSNQSGTTTITVTVTDSNGGTSSDTFLLTVTAANDNPTAVNDTATVAEDSVANAINVLANDNSAPDAGETLTVTAKTNGTSGTVAITGGGTGLTYTPNANYNGSDSFTYTISDGNGGTATATVNVTITSVNDAPDGGERHGHGDRGQCGECDQRAG